MNKQPMPKRQPTMSEGGAAHAKLTWNRSPQGQQGYWDYPANRNKEKRFNSLSTKLTSKLSKATSR